MGELCDDFSPEGLAETFIEITDWLKNAQEVENTAIFMFERADHDQSGFLNHKEAGNLLDELYFNSGIPSSCIKFEDAWREMDKDDDGQISLAEWIVFLKTSVGLALKEGQFTVPGLMKSVVADLLKMYDTNGDHICSYAEGVNFFKVCMPKDDPEKLWQNLLRAIKDDPSPASPVEPAGRPIATTVTSEQFSKYFHGKRAIIQSTFQEEIDHQTNDHQTNEEDEERLTQLVGLKRAFQQRTFNMQRIKPLVDECFSLLDTDNSGNITHEEGLQFLTTVYDMNADKANATWKQFVVQHNGHGLAPLSLDQFSSSIEEKLEADPDGAFAQLATIKDSLLAGQALLKELQSLTGECFFLLDTNADGYLFDEEGILLVKSLTDLDMTDEKAKEHFAEMGGDEEKGLTLVQLSEFILNKTQLQGIKKSMLNDLQQLKKILTAKLEQPPERNFFAGELETFKAKIDAQTDAELAARRRSAGQEEHQRILDA